jgi:hypothetical protein
MQNAGASVVVEGERLFRATGEVEFEPWGLTGAAVYNCTRWAARHLDGGRGRWTLELEIDGEILCEECMRDRFERSTDDYLSDDY